MRDQDLVRSSRVVVALRQASLAWLALSTVALIALLVGTGPVGIASLRGLETRIGIKLPPGSSLVEAQLNPKWSGQVVATVLIPRERIGAFLGSAPFSGTTSRTEATLQRAEWRNVPLRSWRPETAKQFVAADAMYHDKSYAISVLAALDDSPLATVYVAWDLL
ncbi:MAG: hypothetical protein ABFE07_24365 [Armatimonadia bacterium]